MQYVRLFRSRTGSRNLAALLLCASMLCFVALATEAQSGRRGPKPSVNLPPVPTPTPTPEPKAKKPSAPGLPLLVVGNATASSFIPLGYAEAVMETVARRLSESGALMVNKGDKNVNRKAASDKAKTQKEAHVVWVQLEETGGYYPTSRGSSDSMRISYAVYFPETGKTKTQGVVYLRESQTIMGQRIGRVPPCYPASVYDYQLVLAGIEVADRIMDAFNLPLPPVCQ